MTILPSCRWPGKMEARRHYCLVNGSGRGDHVGSTKARDPIGCSPLVIVIGKHFYCNDEMTCTLDDSLQNHAKHFYRYGDMTPSCRRSPRRLLRHPFEYELPWSRVCSRPERHMVFCLWHLKYVFAFGHKFLHPLILFSFLLLFLRTPLNILCLHISP